MTKWVVIVYKFNKDFRWWVLAGYKMFYSDGGLLKFLKEQATRGGRYRYEIEVVDGREVVKGWKMKK